VPASPADESAPLETFAAAPKSTWKQEPDGWHYYNAAGTTVKGMRKIDSKYYFFDSLGVMSSNDWVNVNGFWYYFQPVGSLSAKAPALTSGIKQLNSRRTSTVIYQNGRQVTKNFLIHDFYLFDAQGRMRTGLQKVGNQSYYFDSSGKMREGLVNVKGTLRRFVDTSVYGNSVAPMVTKLTRSPYYLTGTKAKATSVKRWLWYLSSSAGEAYSGWKDIGGKRYYFSQGSMVSGLQVIDSKQYYFRGGLNTADGRAPLAKGMFRTVSVVWDSSATVTPFYTWHYSKSDGTVASGWLKYGSQRYYLDQNGSMAIGYYSIDGKYYYFNEQNSERGGKSPLVTKLTRVKLRTYDSAAKRYKTVYEWHNANADGTVKTGLMTLAGQTYYFAYYGLMLSGWQDVDGQTYYFKLDEKSGRAPALTGGIRVIKEQEWVSDSAYKLVSKKYYFDKNGANKAGWKQDAKKAWYYFGKAYQAGGPFDPPATAGAAALTGGRYWVSGTYYTFDRTGKLVSPKRP
jgi:glucan-binding YG repeat protein